MSLFTRLSATIDAIYEAKRMNALFAMNDRELSVRGYNRENLIRGYIEGLGAR